MSKQPSLAVIQMLFALFSCFTLAQAESTPKSESETGIEGVVMISPIHGGPTRQGIPDSKPLTNTVFLVERENQTVASFKTDDQGRFRISLPAGHYTVSGQERKGMIGNFGPFEVDVTAGRMKTVQWDCDSGLR